MIILNRTILCLTASSIALVGHAAAQPACAPSNPTDGAFVQCTGVSRDDPPAFAFESDANDLRVLLDSEFRSFGANGGRDLARIILTGANIQLINEGSMDETDVLLAGPGDHIFENFGRLGISISSFRMGGDESTFINHEGALVTDDLFLSSSEVSRVINDGDFSSGDIYFFGEVESLVENSGRFAKNVRGGERNDIFRNLNGGNVFSESREPALISLEGGNDVVEIHAGSTTSTDVSFDFGAGEDELIGQGGTVSADFFFGAGDDKATISGGSYSSTIIFDSGDDEADISGGTFDLSTFFRFDDGNDRLMVSGGELEAFIDMDSGNDTVEISAGAFIGPNGVVALADGDDILIIEAGSSFTGRASGGFLGETNGDLLIIREPGVDLTRFSGFEVTELDTGTIYKVPSGLVSLSTGQLNVRSGGFIVDRLTFLNGLNVAPEASLSGNGSLRFRSSASAIMSIEGTFQPGLTAEEMSPFTDNTLDIENGDVTLTSKSKLEVTVIEGVSADRLLTAPTTANMLRVSNGGLTLEGGALVITPVTSTGLIGSTEVTIATATDGITGAFGSVSVAGRLVVEGVTIDGTDLIVELRSKLDPLGRLSMAAGTYANYFDDLSAAPEDEETLEFIADLFDIETDEELETALRGLSAEAYASMDLINIDIATAVTSAVSIKDRQRTMIDPDRGLSAWASAFAGRSSQDGGNTDTSGADIDTDGGLIGIAYAVGDGIEVGGFIGTTSSDMSFDDFGATIDVSGELAGLYLTAERGKADLDLVLASMSSDVETTKPIPVLDDIAFGQTDLSAYVAALTVDYRLLSNSSGLNITPYLGWTYIASERGQINEVNAGPGNLITLEQDTKFLFSEIGAEVSTAYHVGDFGVSPTVKVGYSYEAYGHDSETFAALADEDLQVRTQGLNPIRGRFVVDAYVDGEISDGVSLRVGYNGEFGDGLSRFSGQVALKALF